MASWWELDDLTVEMAFGDAPLAASPTYTDVTAYVADVPSIFRGRTSEYAEIAPGMCVIVLRNDDRRFDPDYASGPYFGNLKPMVRTRIKATLGATTLTLFVGYVLSWSQEWRTTDGVVTVSAVDGLRFWQNATLPSSRYGEAVRSDNPFVYWPLQVSTDSDDGFEDLNPLAGQTPTFGSLTLPEGESAALGGLVNLTHPGLSDWPTNFGTVEWISNTAGGYDLSIDWIRDGTQNILIESNSGAVTGYWFNNVTSDQVTAADDGATHHWAITSTNVWPFGTLRLYRDGVEVASETLTSQSDSGFAYDAVSVFVSANASLSHLAFYSSALSAATIQAHVDALHSFPYPQHHSGTRMERVLDDIGYPSALRSIDQGETFHTSYLPNQRVAIEYLREIERAEQGILYFDVDGVARFKSRQTLISQAPAATFSDDGAASVVEYADGLRVEGNSVDTLRNTAHVTYSTGGTITRRDSASVTNYGVADESIRATTLQSREASNLARYIVRRRATPASTLPLLQSNMRISSSGVATDNEFETLAALDIGDSVTVEHTPVGLGAQVVRTLLVQGIEHQIGIQQWTIRLYLSPSPVTYTEAPYLTLGDATYGKIGAADGNLVPY